MEGDEYLGHTEEVLHIADQTLGDLDDQQHGQRGDHRRLGLPLRQHQRNHRGDDEQPDREGMGASDSDVVEAVARRHCRPRMRSGAGPHSGSTMSTRNGLDNIWITRAHAFPVWLLIIATVISLVLAKRKAQTAMVAPLTVLLIVEIAQGL